MVIPDGGDVAGDLASDWFGGCAGFGSGMVWPVERVDLVGCGVLFVGLVFHCSEGVGVMPVLNDLGDEYVLVSHSGDHFMLTFREARDLRDYLTRELAGVSVVELSEEDG